MCPTVFLIVFFVVISHMCTTAIVFTRLYEAMTDVKKTSNGNPRRSAVGAVGDSDDSISMISKEPTKMKILIRRYQAMTKVPKTSNGNPRRSAFGVVGDSDGSIAMLSKEPSRMKILICRYQAMTDGLKMCNDDPRRSAVGVGDSEGSILNTLWPNNFIPATLTDTRMKIDNSITVLNLPKLQVFVIAATSPKRFLALREEITDTIWWDNEAYFLKLNPTSDAKYQSSNIDNCPYTAFEEFGVHNTQSICLDRAMKSWTFNSNRFAPRTLKLWKFLPGFEKMVAAFRVFESTYRSGGQNCESLSFAKTVETAGFDPDYLVSLWTGLHHQIKDKFNKLVLKAGNNLLTWIEYLVVRNKQFVIDNIAIGLKASAPLMQNVNNILDVMMVDPSWISTKNGLFGVRQA